MNNNQDSSPKLPAFTYPGDLFWHLPQEDFEQLAGELRGVSKKNIYISPTGRVRVKRRALTRIDGVLISPIDEATN